MATKTIYVEPLQKRFTVDVKDANKAKRNRSYASASDCCGSRVKQERRCSTCNAEVPTKTQRKIVKIGKDEHLIDASALQQAMNALDAIEEVKLHTFLKDMPEGSEDRFDALVYGLPSEKRGREYAELVAMLDNRVAVGNAVFRNNEFQVLVTAADGVLKIRKLVEESQRNDVDFESAQQVAAEMRPSEELLAVENQILDKATTDSYDVTDFQDTRTQIEEQVVEEYVLNGKLPETPKHVESVQKQQEQDEIERLKALAGGE